MMDSLNNSRKVSTAEQVLLRNSGTNSDHNQGPKDTKLIKQLAATYKNFRIHLNKSRTIEDDEITQVGLLTLL